MAECLADGAGDADCRIGVSELVGASHVSRRAADGDLRIVSRWMLFVSALT